MMIQIDTTFILLAIITLLVLIIAYLNVRINRTNHKIDLLGGVVFALIDGLAKTNQIQKSVIDTLREMNEEAKQDLNKASELSKTVDNIVSTFEEDRS